MTRINSSQHVSRAVRFAATVAVIAGVTRVTACTSAADVALAGGWAVVVDVVRDLLDREGLWDPLMATLGVPPMIDSVRDACRNEVLSTSATATVSYVKQVEAVVRCAAERGFERKSSPPRTRAQISPPVTQHSNTSSNTRKIECMLAEMRALQLCEIWFQHETVRSLFDRKMGQCVERHTYFEMPGDCRRYR